MKIDYKVDAETAYTEIKDFVEYFKGIEQTESDLEKDFAYTTRALRLGNLTIGEQNVPTLTLEEPIKTESGEIAVSEVTFKTRFKTSDHERIIAAMSGKKSEVIAFARTKAFLIGQPYAMMEKLGRFDEKVVAELTNLFL